MNRKPFGIIRHAFQMVGRNIRSYAMLSVTIVLSFTILLGFMGYMDTVHYNRYKALFARDRSLLKVSNMNLNSSSANRLQEKAKQYGTTHSLQYLQYYCQVVANQWILPSGERVPNIPTRVYAISRECWYLEMPYNNSALEKSYQVTWLDGREDANITLEKGQIIMDEQLFLAYGLSKENRTLELGLGINDDYLTETFTVVGLVPNQTPLEFEIYKIPETGESFASVANREYRSTLVLSLDDLNANGIGSSSAYRTVIFYTDQPESISQLIKSLEPNLPVDSVYERQNQALEKIQTEKATKAIVAALLMLILGINLYSCFENALNDRKFEIGVKRAMGASGFSIIRQFFYESMIVMVANIAISVALVVDAGLLLKFYWENIYVSTTDSGLIRYGVNIDYVLYITPYSIGMFAVCAVVLTVVFSLVFAYKTTQVQIVDYLKAE